MENKPWGNGYNIENEFFFKDVIDLREDKTKAGIWSTCFCCYNDIYVDDEEDPRDCCEDSKCLQEDIYRNVGRP
jgi:hypothetical protein